MMRRETVKTVQRDDRCLDKEDSNEGHIEWQAEENLLMDWIFTMYVFMLSRFSSLHCFVTPWTEALQAPLYILQVRILKWGAMPSSRGSS